MRVRSLELMSEPESTGGRTAIYGVVAFQGLVLMFQGATDPDLGAGLAWTDTLRGQ